MHLGLHEPQTRKYLVIKETAKNKTKNSAQPEPNYLDAPQIRAQITRKKQGNKATFQNSRKFKHPRARAATKTAGSERGLTRSAPAATSSSSERKAGAKFASGGSRQKRCPHAPQPGPSPSSSTGGSRGPTGGRDPNATPGLRSPARWGEGRRKLRTPT
jgi:hypothetical protein